MNIKKTVKKDFRIFLLRARFFVIFMFMLSPLSQANQFVSPSQVTLTAQDRILVLAPHPDDEVLGCGGIIQKAVAMKLPLRIVFFTYGDNNQWSFLVYRKHPVVMSKAVESMGLVRHKEALQAAKILGVAPGELLFLGYPDFRTLNIWKSHWGNNPPARGMLTKAKSVPYSDALRPGASYKGEEIVKDLKTIIEEFRPTKIFLSHPADHNPDHRALYLFTCIALWELERELNATLYPYMIHYKNWPLPRGYHPESKLYPPGLFEQQIDWQVNNLSTQEIEIKHRAIKEHRSQFNSSPGYLLSFIRSQELFGDFPVINLKSNAPITFLTFDTKGYVTETPEQLTDEERAAFVGVEERSVYLENKELVLQFRLSRPLGKTVGVSVFVFGYRKDRGFGNMPKLHIKFGAVGHKIYDQAQRMPFHSIKVRRNARVITMRIPLELLGNPQRILTSANTYFGIVPLDWVSWRILEISS